jgi:hypothetical protein
MKLIGKIQVPAALHSGNKSCAFRRGGWLSHAAGPNVWENIFHISIRGQRQFFFFGTTTQIGPQSPRFDISRSHTIKHPRTHTPSRTSLNQRSARRTNRYLHSTQLTQETNSYALSGIRTCDPSDQEASNISLHRRASV